MNLYPVLLPVVRAIVKPLWAPKVSGLNNLPKSGAVILASNHQAAAEAYIIPVVLPRHVHWMGKDNLFKGKGILGKIFAWVMRSVNVIPVDRTHPGKGEAALHTGLSVLADGKLLGLFPEGTRSPDGKLYKAKTGAVRLALASGAPIVPTAVLNAFEAERPGSVFPRRGVQMTVSLGRPIDMLLELQHLRGSDSLQGEADVLSEVTHLELVQLSRLLSSRIQELSGQSYVDEYAAEVKKRLKEQTEATS